jgi:hypothetical protein
MSATIDFTCVVDNPKHIQPRAGTKLVITVYQFFGRQPPLNIPDLRNPVPHPPIPFNGTLHTQLNVNDASQPGWITVEVIPGARTLWGAGTTRSISASSILASSRWRMDKPPRSLWVVVSKCMCGCEWPALDTGRASVRSRRWLVRAKVPLTAPQTVNASQPMPTRPSSSASTNATHYPALPRHHRLVGLDGARIDLHRGNRHR